MALGVFHYLAAAGPARIFPLIGAGGLDAVDRLTLSPQAVLTSTPRNASILLVSGDIDKEDEKAAKRLHDQLPHPRATLLWRTTPIEGFASGVDAPDKNLADAIARLNSSLISRERPSEGDLLPDEPPAPWRGKGDHGQGGEGMMGGVPYGRPMAMTAEDIRDGLALDVYKARLGPFLPQFPPGLALDLALQGDVIQEASVARPAYPQDGAASAPLRLIARLLRPLGLEALAQRYLAAAVSRPDDKPFIASLNRRLTLSGAIHAIPADLGRLDGQSVRDRLAAWMGAAAQGEALETETPKEKELTTALVGLEWSEAALVLNSFPSGALRRMSLRDLRHPPERDGDQREEHGL